MFCNKYWLENRVICNNFINKEINFTYDQIFKYEITVSQIVFLYTTRDFFSLYFFKQNLIILKVTYLTHTYTCLNIFITSFTLFKTVLEKLSSFSTPSLYSEKPLFKVLLHSWKKTNTLRYVCGVESMRNYCQTVFFFLRETLSLCGQ